MSPYLYSVQVSFSVGHKAQMLGNFAGITVRRHVNATTSKDVIDDLTVVTTERDVIGGKIAVVEIHFWTMHPVAKDAYANVVESVAIENTVIALEDAFHASLAEGSANVYLRTPIHTWITLSHHVLRLHPIGLIR